mmetsp:Transcript_31083/g.52596  ORF Transcript_31083/g.52596 Transcript_31083/m.52596 type:complete len:291 (+) Transcript_31083:868-1740(+)
MIANSLTTRGGRPNDYSRRERREEEEEEEERKMKLLGLKANPDDGDDGDNGDDGNVGSIEFREWLGVVLPDERKGALFKVFREVLRGFLIHHPNRRLTIAKAKKMLLLLLLKRGARENKEERVVVTSKQKREKGEEEEIEESVEERGEPQKSPGEAALIRRHRRSHLCVHVWTIPTPTMMLVGILTGSEFSDEDAEDVLEDVGERCGTYGAVLGVRLAFTNIASEGGEISSSSSSKGDRSGDNQPLNRHHPCILVSFTRAVDCQRAVADMLKSTFEGRPIIAAFTHVTNE